MDRGRLLVFSLAAFGRLYAGLLSSIGRCSSITRSSTSCTSPSKERADGFPIFWYGWLATAVVIGAIAAWVTPRRWACRLPFDLSWIVPIVMIVAALTYEKRWF